MENFTNTNSRIILVNGGTMSNLDSSGSSTVSSSSSSNSVSQFSDENSYDKSVDNSLVNLNQFERRLSDGCLLSNKISLGSKDDLIRNAWNLSIGNSMNFKSRQRSTTEIINNGASDQTSDVTSNSINITSSALRLIDSSMVNGDNLSERESGQSVLKAVKAQKNNKSVSKFYLISQLEKNILLNFAIIKVVERFV
jgi:hypothetical protein